MPRISKEYAEILRREGRLIDGPTNPYAGIVNRKMQAVAENVAEMIFGPARTDVPNLLDEGPQKPAPRANKYGAVKVPDCPSCGFTHDSKVEAARCAYWHHLMRTYGEYPPIMGHLVDFVEVHPTATIGRGVHYRADFLVLFGDGSARLEDVKGRKPGTDFRRLQKLFNASGHPWAPLRVVYGKKRAGGWEWTEES